MNISSARCSSPFLTAEWRYLLMLQYEVDAAILEPLVPRGMELDRWGSRALVSLVGFRFLNTRVLGVSVPLHRHFDEVNLRFYVRRRVVEGWRRAVVFVREIVPRRVIALVARLWYNEPYLALPMRHEIQMAGAEHAEPGRVRYEWRRGGRWHRLEASTVGPPCPPAENSEEEFISEHHWGYTVQRDGGCLEYQVGHPRWRVWQTSRALLDCEVGPLYGPAFVPHLRGQPVSAFVADGSAVVVFRGRRLPQANKSAAAP